MSLNLPTMLVSAQWGSQHHHFQDLPETLSISYGYVAAHLR
jgi:hypothetical protein